MFWQWYMVRSCLAWILNEENKLGILPLRFHNEVYEEHEDEKLWVRKNLV